MIIVLAIFLVVGLIGGANQSAEHAVKIEAAVPATEFMAPIPAAASGRRSTCDAGAPYYHDLSLPYGTVPGHERPRLCREN